MVRQEVGGKQAQILRVQDHCIELDQDVLQEILLNDRIKDKPVAVISLAGDFRKGKSFMLCFFLRYLYNSGSPVWLGSPSDPLRGFEWRSGCDRHTTGILIWDEVFLLNTPQEKELAVLLMDTQGINDDKSTIKESAAIFALTAMLSSVLVYNLSQNIQENDLQYLQLFTDYGRLAQQHIIGKPFQKLLFLVRDWYHVQDAVFGIDGGRKLLDQRLEVKENQHPQLQDIRKHIRSFFTEISAFLMPHPGLEVATGASFDGQLSKISEDFKEQLLQLVPSLLAPENLIPKVINGRMVTCQQLVIYMTTYVHMFKQDTLPEPKTVFQATAEANHMAAVNTALEQYMINMEKRCGGKKMRRTELDKLHAEESRRAQDTFFNIRKMGGEEISEVYRKILSNKIEDRYKYIASRMTRKPSILETSGCKVVGGVATAGLTIGTVVCSVASLHVHAACCGIAAVAVAGVFVGRFIFERCVGGSYSDTHLSNAEDEKAGFKEASSQRHHHWSNVVETNFIEQRLDQTSQKNDATNKLETIAGAKKKYIRKMAEICGEDKPFVNPDELHALHCRYRQSALKIFASSCKKAGMKPPEGTLDTLAQEIDELFQNFYNQNEAKRGFASRWAATVRNTFKRKSTPYCHLKES